MKLLNIFLTTLLLMFASSAICQTIEIVNPKEGDFVNIEGFNITARAADINGVSRLIVTVGTELWQARSYLDVSGCPKNDYFGFIMKLVTPDIYASGPCSITHKSFPIVAQSGDIGYLVSPGDKLVVVVSLFTPDGIIQDWIYVTGE